MSLEELRAQAEAEDTEIETVTEPEPTGEQESDEAEEGNSEAEGKEAEAEEESDDFELELDGEPEPGQQKHNPVESVVHKLTKERKKRQAAQSEADDLRAKVEALEARLASGSPAPRPQSQPATQVPKFPDMYDKGIDGDRQKYDAAVKKYFTDVEQAKAQQSQQTEQQRKAQQELDDKRLKLAEAAAKFAQDNRIKGDRVVDAVQKAYDAIDQSTGIDGALVHMLASVGEGSERVAYYLGTNDTAMTAIKSKLESDPTGFAAIAEMARMATKLKPKGNRKISSAPEPDEPIKGDGSSASAKALQDKYDKESDPQKLMALRKKAREMGVKLT